MSADPSPRRSPLIVAVGLVIVVAAGIYRTIDDGGLPSSGGPLVVLVVAAVATFAISTWLSRRRATRRR